jgi:hypothetical protein
VLRPRLEVVRIEDEREDLEGHRKFVTNFREKRGENRNGCST